MGPLLLFAAARRMSMLLKQMQACMQAAILSVCSNHDLTALLWAAGWPEHAISPPQHALQQLPVQSETIPPSMSRDPLGAAHRAQQGSICTSPTMLAFTPAKRGRHSPTHTSLGTPASMRRLIAQQYSSPGHWTLRKSLSGVADVSCHSHALLSFLSLLLDGSFTNASLVLSAASLHLVEL